jgi:general secretion pathway protein A
VYPDGNTSVKVFVDRINEFLIETHATGRKTVVIIEEAQNLRFDVLEQLRLLTNLETNERKLLQIIMVGQPELRDMLKKPELSQLSQRITARYHLGPLSGEEVVHYVSHRLSVAGGPGGLFPASAMKRLSRLTGGIPRLINVLCDRALLGTYVQGKERVDKATLKRAAQEVFGETGGTAALGNKYEKIFAGVMIIILGIALSAYYYFRMGRTGDTAGVPSQVHITGKVSERPRLDTLWWFDRWSVLQQGPEEGASAMRYEDRWAVQGQLRTQSPANEQKHSDAAVGQAPDAAVRSRAE